MSDNDMTPRMFFTLVAVCAFLIFGGVGGCMFGKPHYDVWQQGMAGKAKLAEAEYGRQTMVQEAHAKMESAKSLAQAEVERAKGVAEANKIIGESLKDNESYLRYLWLHNLESGSHDVIYVPTEANLPIMEATRFSHQQSERAAEKSAARIANQ